MDGRKSVGTVQPVLDDDPGLPVTQVKQPARQYSLERNTFKGLEVKLNWDIWLALPLLAAYLLCCRVALACGNPELPLQSCLARVPRTCWPVVAASVGTTVAAILAAWVVRDLCCHWVACKVGVRAQRVLVGGILGTRYAVRAPAPGPDLLIALAGPAVGLVQTGIWAALVALLQAAQPDRAGACTLGGCASFVAYYTALVLGTVLYMDTLWLVVPLQAPRVLADLAFLAGGTVQTAAKLVIAAGSLQAAVLAVAAKWLPAPDIAIVLPWAFFDAVDAILIACALHIGHVHQHRLFVDGPAAALDEPVYVASCEM